METIKELNEILGFNVPIDGLMSALLKKKQIDIVKFDEKLSQHIPGYDNEKCTYKNKPVSCDDIVKIIYGERALKLVNELL